MIELLALRALVADSDRVSEIVAPPYDALGPDGRAAYAAEHPNSFLNVVLSRNDVAGTEDRDAAAGGSARFERMYRAGLYVDQVDECFYLYELDDGGHRQLGLLAGIPTTHVVDGKILGHERTLEVRSRELADFYRRVRLSSSPAAVAVPDAPEFEALLEELAAGPPMRAFTSEDGVRQRLWKVEAPADSARLVDAGRQLRRLYITDGHHRFGASLVPGALPGWVLSVLFPSSHLKLLEYNRAVTLNSAVDLDILAGSIGADWSIERLGLLGEVDPRPTTVGSLAMLFDRVWYRLQPTEIPDDPRAGLDVVMLHDRLLGPAFGIRDGNDPRLSFVVGDDAISRLEAAGDRPDTIGFALHPTALDQIMAVADAGLTMPAKSTYFAPKPRSGLVVVRW